MLAIRGNRDNAEVSHKSVGFPFYEDERHNRWAGKLVTDPLLEITGCSQECQEIGRRLRLPIWVGEQCGICSELGVAGVVRVLKISDAWLKFERTIL